MSLWAERVETMWESVKNNCRNVKVSASQLDMVQVLSTFVQRKFCVKSTVAFFSSFFMKKHSGRKCSTALVCRRITFLQRSCAKAKLVSACSVSIIC